MLALLAAGGGTLGADDAADGFAGVLAGRVSAAAAPLPFSDVYAYQLSDFSLRRVIADAEGNFLFRELPAGLYKVIAHKSGFVPAIALLSRATEGARQYLHLELLEDAAGPEGEPGEGFWAVRERIPSDVLREIEGAVAATAAGREEEDERTTSLASLIKAEMRAVAGMEQNLELGDAQRAGGWVGIEGAFRDVSIGLSGNFVELQQSDAAPEQPFGGTTQVVSLRVENGNATGVELSSLNNRLMTRPMRTEHGVVDFRSHRLSWNQAVGEASRSTFSAQYVEESNFYSRGPVGVVPMGIPRASRSWTVEGSYSTAPSERATLSAGLRYRERTSEDQRLGLPTDVLPEERMDLFGTGGYQLRPAVVVEVGLYSALRDGSLSLAPKGGLVFQLGPEWRAYTAASYQIHEEELDELHHDFTPALLGELASCELAEQYCYQVLVSRVKDGEESLRIGVIHRRFAETLRLYFTEDFFNHLESLYLVQGDSLPELQLALSRRITPRVLARLESSLASGGGGILYAADDSSYENEIRYLVTSLDTRFEQTSTGVFVAFHHVAQQLNPVGGRSRSLDGAEVEIERLQLMLTQDLDVLSLAADLALRLNMEVSRGSAGDGSHYDEEELRKRVTGGIAVKF